MAGRVAVVTGAAQGFGREIAQGLAEAGATVFVADLNLPGARATAATINGVVRGRAIPVHVDVTKEPSVARLMNTVVRRAGGLDLLVSNAGVLRAGSVTAMDAATFRFVTEVNYTGYFLCVKHAARVMALRRRASAHWTGDIIQINSKSGLEGSNRNAAYAGAKFGGIGLTQSFALELLADGIKVNAVCPGNYFESPLWSDPVRGLFVQYLREGKVPGARTVADVRRFYEAKVPMGRGCTGGDVLRAILYIVGQPYETGQAVPVTGGQVMLR
jgi:sorbitol-6-phosphate 2-dehydrogenase